MTERLADAINLRRREAQLIITGGLIVIRWIVLAVVHRRIADSAVWYRAAKPTCYIITILGGIAVLILVGEPGSPPTSVLSRRVSPSPSPMC